MNPWIVLLAVLAVGSGGFKLGVDHELAQQSREEKLLNKAEKAMTDKAVDAIAALRPKYTTIQGKLEKQIETNTVYRDCKLDPIGLQLVNEALTSGTQTAPPSKLSKTDETGK